MADHVLVHIHPKEIGPEDVLTDGDQQDARRFEIAEPTILVWIDLHPDARFAHDTRYILLSASSLRTEAGMWWPVLNGERILYGGQGEIEVPLELRRNTG